MKQKILRNLSEDEKNIANKIIYSNKFNDIDKYRNDKNVYKVLQYYTINKEIPMTKLVFS